MPRCAVIGDPVEHSLSPTIHRAAYADLGLSSWQYTAIAVQAGDVAGFVGSLDADWAGLSVTAPHKREALSFAVEATERSRLSGAANTLVPIEGAAGRSWRADNTDIPGAIAAIGERFSGAVSTAVIIGGGATAASVGLAVAEMGADFIALAVRDPERARESVGVIAGHPDRPQVEVLPLDGAGGASMLVSTVPASAQTPELVRGWLGDAPPEVVFEVTYNVWPTPLAVAAQAAGVPVVSGLDLLIHQAALQFEMFTGRVPSVAVMRAAGEAELARRQQIVH